jgi:hypothetical protein
MPTFYSTSSPLYYNIATVSIDLPTSTIIGTR